MTSICTTQAPPDLERNEAVDLPRLAELVGDAVSAAEQGANSTMQHALRAGELLVRAKELVRHGDWIDWLKANCRLAPRTAQAYMRLPERLKALAPQEAQRVAHLPVREALRAITTPAEAKARGKGDRGTAGWQGSAGIFSKCASGLKKLIKDRPGPPEHDQGALQSLRENLTLAIEEIDRITARGVQE